MGISNSSCSEEKKKEWININRVSRQEQYDWFKTLRDADEEDIVHIIRTSPQMITTVMYFDTYYINDKVCSCCSELEQCVLPNEPRKEAILKRLENSITFGVCPHVLLHQQGKVPDALAASEEELNEAFTNVNVDETSFVCNGLGCGFYWIHLTIILRRKRVIQAMLPVLREFVFPSFVWYTVQNWFSPLYLAILSEDQELSELLCTYYPNFLQDKIRIKSYDRNFMQTNAVTMIERIASLDKVESLKTLINISSLRNKALMQITMKGAFSTRAFSCILFLMEKGVKLDKFTLKNELDNSVFRDDVEMIYALLKYHNVKVSPVLLKSAVKKGNVKMVESLLQHIPILRKKTKYYAEYSACLTEAVLLNSKTIVELLIQKNVVVNVCFKNLSALRWATIFQFNEIKQLLQESGASSFLEDETINMCVFNSVLNINQRNDHLIRRLLELGQDVNDSSDGTPPFYTTMRLRRYDVMQALLLRGADPYIQPDTWKYFLIRQTVENWRLLIHVFVSANVNLSCDVKFSLLEYICTSNSTFFKNGEMARLIVLSAHTITEKDRLILKDNLDTWQCPVLKSDINDHLYKPKPLSIICRNSIRRQYGQNLHKFIDMMGEDLPTKFVNLLQCTDVLEQFYTPYDRRKFTTEFVKGLFHHQSTTDTINNN